jgi:hypothetical protein
MDECLKRIEALEKRVDALKAVIAIQLKINEKILEQLKSLTGATDSLSKASITHSKIFESLAD